MATQAFGQTLAVEAALDDLLRAARSGDASGVLAASACIDRVFAALPVVPDLVTQGLVLKAQSAISDALGLLEMGAAGPIAANGNATRLAFAAYRGVVGGGL
jgi:hypothetical protein